LTLPRFTNLLAQAEQGRWVTKTIFSTLLGESQLITAFSSECKHPQFPASSLSHLLGKPEAFPLYPIDNILRKSVVVITVPTFNRLQVDLLEIEKAKSMYNS
jgi:hypothetical protein